MLTYMLLAGVAPVILGNAWAYDGDCISEDAANLVAKACSGYTKSAFECDYKGLECPFDSSKYYCSGTKECEVGDIVYSDDNCYADASALPDGATPIAVVFDTTNKLAIELDVKLSLAFMSGYTTGLTSDSFCGGSINNCKQKGVLNCSQDADYYECVYGCKTKGINFDAIDYDNPKNYRTTSPSFVGFNDTGKLVDNVDGRSGYTTPAAGYCMGKNVEWQGDVVHNHARWFLPAIGDLQVLYDNKAAVIQGIKNAGKTVNEATLAADGGVLWSSTQYMDATHTIRKPVGGVKISDVCTCGYELANLCGENNCGKSIDDCRNTINCKICTFHDFPQYIYTSAYVFNMYNGVVGSGYMNAKSSFYGVRCAYHYGSELE